MTGNNYHELFFYASLSTARNNLAGHTKVHLRIYEKPFADIRKYTCGHTTQKVLKPNRLFKAFCKYHKELSHLKKRTKKRFDLYGIFLVNKNKK